MSRLPAEPHDNRHGVPFSRCDSEDILAALREEHGDALDECVPSSFLEILNGDLEAEWLAYEGEVLDLVVREHGYDSSWALVHKRQALHDEKILWRHTPSDFEEIAYALSGVREALDHIAPGLLKSVIRDRILMPLTHTPL